MKKVEITAEEYEEYIHLRSFYEKVDTSFYSFNINFLNLKVLAFQALAPENITSDMFRLIAETVSRTSTDFNIIKSAYDDMPALIKDKKDNNLY